mmetsp:Transcript_85338/g.231597  ORF Transcript_85338/g.231597 Transcript_85338/m.231597 type:complete len:107 (-) Transcript_85338:70-390(-)
MDFVEVLFKTPAAAIPVDEMILFISKLRGGNVATVKDVIDSRRMLVMEMEEMKAIMAQVCLQMSGRPSPKRARPSEALSRPNAKNAVLVAEQLSDDNAEGGDEDDE